MITCSACGKENEASAFECRRCRAPLRDDVVEPEVPPAHELVHAHHQQPAHHEAPAHEPAFAHEAPASSSTLGEVCRNCEAYNEPGVHACTNCGHALFVEPADATSAFEPALDKTPPHPFVPPDTSPSHAVSLDHTPPGGVPSLSDELSALAISDEEAAEAGLDTQDRDRPRQPHFESPEEEPLGKTPPQAFQTPFHDEPVHEKTPAQPFAAPSHDEPLGKTPPQAFQTPFHDEPHQSHQEPASAARPPPPEAHAHAAGEPAHAEHEAAADSWGAAEEPHRPEARHEEPAPAPHPVRSRVAEIAGVAAGAAMASAGIAAAALVPGRRSPAAEPVSAKAESAPPVAKAEPVPPPKAEPVPAPAEKLCASCGAGNPPAAKFCFDCGTPFAKKAPPPAVEAKAEPKRGAEPEVKARPEVKPEPAKPEPPKPFARPDLGDATSESAPVSLFTEAPPDAAPLAAAAWGEEPPAVELAEALHDESLAAAHEVHAEPAPEHVEELTEAAPAELLEEAPAVEGFEELHAEEATPAEEPAFAEEALPEEFAAELGEPLGEAVEEALAPFHASLIVEKGAAPGTAFLLGLMHNSIGAAGAHVELAEDPFIAPQAATLLFADDHLVLRDEGTANGVFVKIRETANLEAGDQFTAGERLFRYDGVVELAKNEESATPFLGAPRPQGPQAVRIAEVLAGGKTGRTCHRSGPTISIGRSGCDMNFPADGVLAARHAEIRLAEDGSASLVDLGAGDSGVWLRVRQQASFDLVPGDRLQIGEQLLRLEIG